LPERRCGRPRGTLDIMTAATWGLLVATFVARFLEMVETTPIVLAIGKGMS
jgi:hypothetical protein